MGLDFMHNSSAVAEQVITIVAEQAMVDKSEVRMDMRLADLGLDSLGLVECIFGIEEAFNITVPFNSNTPDQAGFDISSVGAIISEVEKLLSCQAA